MKKTKKVLSVLLCAILAISLVACAAPGSGGGGAAPAASGGSEALTGNLRFWHHNTGDNRRIPIQDGVDEFTTANPGVSVEVEVIANDVYKTQLRTAMAGGDGPGIFHSWGGGWLQAFAREGLVVDISNDVSGWAHHFSPAAVGMVTFDGGMWAVPYINSATFLYYNIEMFDRLGISPPNTMAELEHVAQVLLDNGIVPFAEANLTRWPGAQHFVFLSMRIGGPDIFQRAISGEVRFDDPVFIQAGEKLQDMVRKGWFPEGHNGMNWDTGESRMMMYAEQAGMILQTSGFIASAFNENQDFFPHLGIHQYPAVEGGAGIQTDMLAGVNALSVSVFADNPTAAVGLIEVLTTGLTTQQGLADGGTIAALRGVTYGTEQLQTGVGILANATFMQNFIDQTLTPRLTDAHLGTAQALHGLTMTPVEAAAEMQRVYEADDGSFD